MSSMKLKDNDTKLLIIKYDSNGYSQAEISQKTGIPTSTINDFLNRRAYQQWWLDYDEKVIAGVMPIPEGPKILTLDVETAPILSSVWRLFKENIGINQIEQDWYLLSWAAKWFHENEVLYQDKRDSWNSEDDYELLLGVHKLLDEADILITQNGKNFDEKKLNTRFILNGLKPPSSYRHIDTLEIAKRHFGFSSNKLEYMTDRLCKKYKKSKHIKFPGFELWKECLKGNPAAWDEMEEYNIFDVLSLEELYIIIRPWYKNHPNINLYFKDNDVRCRCGSVNLKQNGYAYTNLSKFVKWTCQDCGAEVRDRVNVLPKNKRETLKGNVL